MLFTKSGNDCYICDSTDDITSEDKICGYISLCSDGFWRWHTHRRLTMNCQEMKLISLKIGELNKDKNAA